MHARLRGSKSLLALYKIINKPDFPPLADEIAKTRPDVNIKVAAFTVSEKSSNKWSARDPKYSWFHEHSKNWIYHLYLHFIINI